MKLFFSYLLYFCLASASSVYAQVLIYEEPRGMENWEKPYMKVSSMDHLNTWGLASNWKGTYLAMGYTNEISRQPAPYLREKMLLLYRSDDDGHNWTQIGLGPDDDMKSIHEIAYRFAFIDRSPETNTDLMLSAGPILSHADGVFTIENTQHRYRSDDKGATWSYTSIAAGETSNPLPVTETQNVFTAKNGQVMYSIDYISHNYLELGRSTDWGVSYQPITTTGATVGAILDVCSDGSLIVRATLDGDNNRSHRLVISEDGEIEYDLGRALVDLRFTYMTFEGRWLAGTPNGLFLTKEKVCEELPPDLIPSPVPKPKFGKAFDYIVPGVSVIYQETTKYCWIATLQMMLAWREKIPGLTARGALIMADPELGTWYDDPTKLSNVPDGLYDLVHYNYKPYIQSYANEAVGLISVNKPVQEAKQILQLLKTKGPLQYNIDPCPEDINVTGHSVVVTGIKYNGGDDEPLITYHDPFRTTDWSDGTTQYCSGTHEGGPRTVRLSVFKSWIASKIKHQGTADRILYYFK